MQTPGFRKSIKDWIGSLFDMSRRRIPENVRWQIIGMHGAGMSCRNTGVNLDINHTVISRLVRKHADTGHVMDRSRQGHKTTPRALVRLARVPL